MTNSKSALMQFANPNVFKMIGNRPNDQPTSGSDSYGIVTKMKGMFGIPEQLSSRSDHYGSYSSGYEECDNGISLGLLLTALAALAVMLYVLYTKVEAIFV